MKGLLATSGREAPQAAAMETELAQLIDLPDELILPILEVLCRHCDGRNCGSHQEERESQKALVSFSKTCFRYHRLARPYLFHHVYFNYNYHEIREHPWLGWKQEQILFRLLQSLAGDHVPDPDALEAAGKRSLANGIDDLATSIKHLEVNLTPNLHIESGRVGKTWKAPSRETFGFDWLPEILNRATNLEHLELHMELPLNKHAGFIQSMDQYGRARYNSINTLSFIYRASCYDKITDFDLRDTHMIFNRCRNLATLELHGIGGLGERFAETTYVTSKLKTLRLTNCSLRASDFDTLIAGIKNLESFTLGRGELHKFQLIAEYGYHSLRHLELGPFEMTLWQCIWHLNRFGTEAEKLEAIRTATIHTLRSFEKLEHVQLAQDSILGVSNMWTSCYYDIPFVLLPTLLPGDTTTEQRLGLWRIDTSLPDPDGTRLVDMLPRTLKSLRLTHVNNKLAESLLTFATAVSLGEFPELKEVSLHGQDPLMERCRYGNRFQIEFLFALERHWDFLKDEVLQEMKDLLNEAGVKLSWEAMGSNRPTEGWPDSPTAMLRSCSMYSTPRITEEDRAFTNFNMKRNDWTVMLQRLCVITVTETEEEYDDHWSIWREDELD
ncbi:hypothetical protein CGLO_12874 [Colletotrichum gloeosporioides Cg-14]|uniref:Uncharacterized protein n=1 Tax=Colletotrichum gloeosporioides (strain Cg-14) TaxID=1237896 RepID=T0LIK5_COLGC|nr:hypothetical protein CGLO_12874 [Colletotrichum gloeosporioides Cg-14]